MMEMIYQGFKILKSRFLPVVQGTVVLNEGLNWQMMNQHSKHQSIYNIDDSQLILIEHLNIHDRDRLMSYKQTLNENDRLTNKDWIVKDHRNGNNGND